MKLILKYYFPFFFALLVWSPSHPQSKANLSESRHFTIGNIDELYSKELGEKRILNIYLPDGYQKDKSLSYPVIYLLDGSADEDFIHISGLVQYNSFEWVNRCAKSIVVGIASVDRRRDFTFETTVKEQKESYPTTGHSSNFLSFIEKELQPYIRSTYRTTSTATLMGQSLGGLFATEVLLTKPSLFSNYIIVSPSLWWNKGSLLDADTSILKTVATKTNIYIGVGKEGITPGPIPRMMEVDANLLADKLLKTGNKRLMIHFDYLPDEDHATVYHQAVLNAFKVFSRSSPK